MKRSWLRSLLLVLVIALSSVTPALATPQANQTVRCADLVSAVGAGSFTWASGAKTCSNNNLLITRAVFVSWITNTGSCAAGGNATYYMMTYGDMLNCKSGGTASQQSKNAYFTGSTTYTDIHGACQQSQAVTSAFTTTSAVAPTTSGAEIAWTGTGNNAAFTLQILNPSSTVVETYSVPANTVSSFPYYAAGAAAGVYTVTESGLTSYTCPTIGGGQHAYGTLTWYQ